MILGDDPRREVQADGALHRRNEGSTEAGSQHHSLESLTFGPRQACERADDDRQRDRRQPFGQYELHRGRELVALMNGEQPGARGADVGRRVLVTTMSPPLVTRW